MSSYTISDFWKSRLPLSRPRNPTLIRGWNLVERGLATYQEAPLTLSEEFGSTDDPESSPVIFVSAPGAVGKSTLGREIAFATNAIFVDLATADPVGGNTISGGLAKSNVFGEWQSELAAVLIDGLDEARLRVTQGAFEAFLDDVAQISVSRRVPTVLFGRTGAVLDAWLLFDQRGMQVPVLEIGFFDRDSSIAFTMAALREIKPNASHQAAEREAVELLIDGLRSQTETDGNRFAGYAPVLRAVASRVAQESNPSQLVSQIQKGSHPITLKGVASAILDRERTKLQPLPFGDTTLHGRLYAADEQLARLVAKVYGLRDPAMPPMSPKDSEMYASALETWVSEHPFLDGANRASSAVFEAIIASRALQNPASAKAAVERELSKGAAANPFLADFYVSHADEIDPQFIPPDQIGIVYASLRAGLSLGDRASLSVEGAEDGEDEALLRAEVEILVARRNMEQIRSLSFATEQVGTLRLGGYVEDVDVTIPWASVEIGAGQEAILVSPVSIQCDHLIIAAKTVIVEAGPGDTEGAAYIEAKRFSGELAQSVPILRGAVSLGVSWPGAEAYPWTGFATEPSKSNDPRLDEALRRLRKFVISFRSHSRGNLARYQHKIEGARMTKGSGRAVLNSMVAKGILTLQAQQYYLDPQALYQHAGMTYTDGVSRRFSAKAVEFVSEALRANDL